MIEYKVIVLPNGSKLWYLNGERHCEDGPAITYGNGVKVWFLNGKILSEEEHRERTQASSNKVIEIDGKRYKLVEA